MMTTTTSVYRIVYNKSTCAGCYTTVSRRWDIRYGQQRKQQQQHQLLGPSLMYSNKTGKTGINGKMKQQLMSKSLNSQVLSSKNSQISSSFSSSMCHYKPNIMTTTQTNTNSKFFIHPPPPIRLLVQQEEKRYFSNTSTGRQPLVTFHIDDSDDDSSSIGTTKYLSNIDKRHLGKIGTITLNTPHNYNALTMEVGYEFQQLCYQIIDELRYNPNSSAAAASNSSSTSTTSKSSNSLLGASNVQVIVLTGNGPAFSSGGNLQWLQSLQYNSIQSNIDIMMQFYTMFHTIRQIPVPIIGAINGPAMGAGACLALLCDFRTGSIQQQTKLGFHFTKLGLSPGMGGTKLLSLMIQNPTLLNEILLFGKVLTGHECYSNKYNIINRLHETDAVHAAYEMAIELITTTHPVATRTTLQTLRNNYNTVLSQKALYHEATQQALCYSQPDWGEGLKAIAERRLPVFTDTYHPPPTK